MLEAPGTVELCEAAFYNGAIAHQQNRLEDAMRHFKRARAYQLDCFGADHEATKRTEKAIAAVQPAQAQATGSATSETSSGDADHREAGAGASSAGPGMESAGWNCARCTFFNEGKNTAQCSMCACRRTHVPGRTSPATATGTGSSAPIPAAEQQRVDQELEDEQMGMAPWALDLILQARERFESCLCDGNASDAVEAAQLWVSLLQENEPSAKLSLAEALGKLGLALGSSGEHAHGLHVSTCALKVLSGCPTATARTIESRVCENIAGMLFRAGDVERATKFHARSVALSELASRK